MEESSCWGMMTGSATFCGAASVGSCKRFPKDARWGSEASRVSNVPSSPVALFEKKGLSAQDNEAWDRAQAFMQSHGTQVEHLFSWVALDLLQYVQ